MDINKYLKSRITEINREFKAYLPSKRNILSEAIRYSLFSGGKRLRVILAMEIYRMIKGKKPRVFLSFCALELIHTFTLIHDDLPCMDNSDTRRGRPSSHKVYGPAVAILAGDALLSEAYRLMALDCIINNVPAEKIIEIINSASSLIGPSGTAYGQMLDILHENYCITPEKLREIYSLKTGAILKLSVGIGAVLADASAKSKIKLDEYAENLGIAYQIKDDILDFKDSKIKEEINYVSICGAEKAERDMKKYFDKSIEALAYFGEKAGIIEKITGYMIDRKA